MQIMILILSGIVLFAISMLAFILLFMKQKNVVLPVIGMIIGIIAIIGAWVLKSMGMQVAPFLPSGNRQQGFKTPTFAVGETWKVDGEWELTILDIHETEERNDYDEWKPDIVYEVDYQYTNLGYDTEYSRGLYMYLDYSAVDNAGMEAKEYSGYTQYYPQSVPVGATCYAENFVAVSERGPVKFTLTEYDSDGNAHEAVFIADPEVPRAEVEIPKVDINDDPLKIGETWVVDGQWKFTINSVRESELETDYNGMDPEKVYVVDYTYENIGFDDGYGLYMYLDSCVVDSAGMMGYSYPGDVDSYPKSINPGETCNAQDSIGVDHAGSFRIYMSEYDDNDELFTQTFLVEVD